VEEIARRWRAYADCRDRAMGRERRIRERDPLAATKGGPPMSEELNAYDVTRRPAHRSL
jgi:hypothetical protein